MNLYDFSKAISALNKGGEFPGALAFFEENKAAFTGQIAGNSYLVTDMLNAYRKTNNILEAFQFIELYNIKIDDTTHEHVLTKYGWLLFDKYKLENKSDASDGSDGSFGGDDGECADNTHHAISAISDTFALIKEYLPLILQYNNMYTNSVVSQIFNIVQKTEKKKNNVDWDFLNELCAVIPPGRLATSCDTIQVKRKGKIGPMELASDRETWYAIKSKALFETENYEECIEVSKKALETFEKFHYSNDAWFARRIALAKKHLGNATDALNELLSILKKKREWFIQYEIAVIYSENNELDKAYAYAVDAINNFGDLEYKVGLLAQLADILRLRGESELSFKHYMLAKLLRMQEGWKVPAALEAALHHAGQPQMPPDQLPALRRELQSYWVSLKPQNQGQRLTGKIIKILHDNDVNGTVGFIKYDGNKSIYFRLNVADALRNKLRAGLEDVEFEISPPNADGKTRAVRLSG